MGKSRSQNPRSPPYTDIVRKNTPCEHSKKGMRAENMQKPACSSLHIGKKPDTIRKEDVIDPGMISYLMYGTISMKQHGA